MTDAERLDKMQEQVDSIQRDVRQLLNRLEYAVLQAAAHGDELA